MEHEEADGKRTERYECQTNEWQTEWWIEDLQTKEQLELTDVSDRLNQQDRLITALSTTVNEYRRLGLYGPVQSCRIVAIFVTWTGP